MPCTPCALLPEQMETAQSQELILAGLSPTPTMATLKLWAVPILHAKLNKISQNLHSSVVLHKKKKVVNIIVQIDIPHTKFRLQKHAYLIDIMTMAVYT